MPSLPPYATTGVGSLPHADPAAAVRHVLRAYDLPFCPQLPRAEGDMVREWLGGEPPACGWSPDRDRERPAAWDAFVAAVRAAPPAHGLVKLQVTGPATLATALEGPGDAGLAREIATWLAANAAGQVAAAAGGRPRRDPARRRAGHSRRPASATRTSGARCG